MFHMAYAYPFGAGQHRLRICLCPLADHVDCVCRALALQPHCGNWQFDLLRCWMERHASGDMRVQAVMVAFCFGALLEGTAGFGAPVAVTSFLLLALGFKA